ncbi:MAG: chromosomal replication initiator protein DnaA [Patescibacteria group bacterium]|jgi:chromosomal replication initiator protein
MTNLQLWQAVLGELELNLTKANFTTWFKNTAISFVDGEKITVGVPNTFTKAWLENKYHQSILKTLQKIVGGHIKEVTYRVEAVKPQTQKMDVPSLTAQTAPEKPTISAEAPSNRFGLNPKYTFPSFIVGKNNELAHAAAQAVAKNPGKSTYNPLFIYGGVGLGKTHLLQGIGHAILGADPNKKILYTTSEKFTNDYIQAIRSRTTERFKQTYRSPDLLLIDDVQFMAAKDGTQQEFFHTFNDLHQADKQIVMTSDRPPKAIPALEQRLVSRFEWGMIADISQPDYETRNAILKAKCVEKGLSLDQKIIDHIAIIIQNNIRELEGALNKIIAYEQFQHTPPTLELVKRILASHVVAGRKSATPKQLINTVAEFYDLKLDDLLGQSREKRLAFPRQIVMYLMRKELESSYPAIGQELGGRDHTTAMHAFDKITHEVETSDRLKQEIEQIKQRLYN